MRPLPKPLLEKRPSTLPHPLWWAILHSVSFRILAFCQVAAASTVMLRFLVVLAGVTGLAGLTGCDRSTTVATPQGSWRSVEPRVVQDELSAVWQRYKRCQTYRDRGILTLKYQQGDRQISERTELDFRFQRPNKLRLSVRQDGGQLKMISDGKSMWAAIDDPESDHLRGQVVKHQAPSAPTIDDLYALTDLMNPQDPDRMRSALQGLPLGLHLSHVGFVLPHSGFRTMMETITAARVRPPQPGDPHSLRVYELTTRSGQFNLWISTVDQTIRRIDFPTADLFQDVPQASRPRDVGLTLDLKSPERDVRFDVAAFRFTLPTNAQTVQYFVLPPTRPPTEQFGEVIDPLLFVTESHDRVSSKQWSGVTSVLVWFDNHPTSRAILPVLSRLAKQYQRNDSIQFLAVCVAGRGDVVPAELRQRLTDWNVTLPVVWDRSASGRESLGIEQSPTVAVIDEAHRLQFFSVGANPRIGQEIDDVLHRIQQGENVGATIAATIQHQEKQFRQQLELAKTKTQSSAPLVGSGAAAVASGDVSDGLPSPTRPKTYQLKQSWQVGIDRIASPGNLLVIRRGTSQQLAVLNEARDIVRLRLNGQPIESHSITTLHDEPITQLRQSTGGAALRGPQYIAFTRFGRHVYALDRRFQVLWHYPDIGSNKKTIADVLLADVDADGTSEVYVGYADATGVDRVDDSGNRVWHGAENVTGLSICQQPAGDVGNSSNLLVATQQGGLVTLSADGQALPRVLSSKRPVYRVVSKSASTAADSSDYLGMSFTIDNREIAVGFDRQLSEVWAYGLPGGRFRHQVDSPQNVVLFSSSATHWLLAGPDGSIHLIRDDGGRYDSFRMGLHIRGLTGLRTEREARLVVVTDNGVTCFAVTDK